MAERRSKLGRPLASEAPGPKVRTVKFEARIKELIENLPDLAELVEPLAHCPAGALRGTTRGLQEDQE
jgi:hypothetical protein